MHYLDDEDNKDENVTTHGDTSPDPGEEHDTDPLIGEGSDADKLTDVN